MNVPEENTDRKRSPRKFTDGISLTLTAVEDGSAIAKIALNLAVSGLIPTSQQACLEQNGQKYDCYTGKPLIPMLQQAYLEQARDAIVGAIAAAGDNKSPTTYLPRKALAYFDRLGRSLLDDEAIEFTTPARAETARLTKETRLRLLKAAEVTERSEEIHIRGGIFDFNQEDMIFKMMLSDGGEVAGPVGRQHFDTFLEASYGYRQGVKVLLDGVGKYNRADRLQKIESVEHVTLLDPLDFPSQLEELKVLKDGWYDGKGYAPLAGGLDWLAAVVNERYSDSLPLPYVYPVAEGGVRLEWTLGANEVSLEIDFRDRAGEWHCLNLETDDEEARPLKLDTTEGWDWMVGRLQALEATAS
jgi:hypothetical protein